MGFFSKFINRRNDREANEYRLCKQRDEGEISFFFNDSKTDSFITVEVNDDGSKGYELVRNYDDQENFDNNWNDYISDYEEEEEKNCIDYYSENKMTREDKIDRLNQIRENGKYNKKIPEKKIKKVVNNDELKKKQLEKDINNIIDSYFG